MGINRLAIIIGLSLIAPRGLLLAEDTATARPDEPPAAAATATDSFSVESRSGTVRVDREIMGVVVQDLSLFEMRRRNNMREYRLILRLRNATQDSVVPILRLVLWSRETPETAFDINGVRDQIVIAPRSIRKFNGDFKLDDKVRLERFTLVPLPPEVETARVEQPSLPSGAVQPTGGAPQAGVQPPQAGAQQPPQTGGQTPTTGQPQLSANELARQQALARYQAEIARMYPQQVMIPGANTMGQFVGIGGFGPVYQVSESSPFGGLYIQAPRGFFPLRRQRRGGRLVPTTPVVVPGTP